jgi:hypothetical protein
MRNIAKTTLIGGAVGLAAYFLVIRPRRAAKRADEMKAVENSSIKDAEISEKFDRMPLKAHAFLARVPIHSLDYIQLNGGRDQMTIEEIYRATGLSDLGEVELGAASKALFWLRGLIGKIMRWDDVPELVQMNSYLSRLSDEERAASLISSGEVRGISRVLYCRENEMVLEIINKTVHCFWVLASEKTAHGYIIYNAVYVKNLNWRTPIYMTFISPVLKRVIYPAINKSMRQNWERNFPIQMEERNTKILTAKI